MDWLRSSAGARKGRRRDERTPAALADATVARWDAYGELAFLLEPDLKEARGGLRDVHALRAVAATWLVEVPSSRIEASYQRLLDVRALAPNFPEKHQIKTPH